MKQEEPPTEPAEAEPAKTELDSTNTPTSQAAEPDPKPAPTPDPPKPTPAIAKAHEAEEDATAAAELVDRAFAAAIQEAQQAEEMAEATSLVTAVLESALFQAESEDFIRAREDNDFGRRAERIGMETFPEGAWVEVRGLIGMPELNGQKGYVVQLIKGGYVVQLTGQSLLFKQKHLIKGTMPRVASRDMRWRTLWRRCGSRLRNTNP